MIETRGGDTIYMYSLIATKGGDTLYRYSLIATRGGDTIYRYSLIATRAQWSARPCEVNIGMTKGYDIPQNIFSRGILPQNNV